MQNPEFKYEEYISTMGFTYFSNFIKYLKQRGHQLVEANYDAMTGTAHIKANILIHLEPNHQTDDTRTGQRTY